ncbi:MAG: AEC family transporter [Burkholderiales bacterium]|nr:AEC family transporter [Burkholderiales bacterium]
MSAAVVSKLLAILIAVAIGYVAGRQRWLGEGDPARVIGQAAYYVFVPALLFRTAARIEIAKLPWHTLAVFFVPMSAVLLAVYVSQRRRGGGAAPAVRALSASFGNSVQIGIPMASALFGEAGLAIHLTIVTLHAMVLLSLATALVEIDLARASGRSSLGQTLLLTLRNTVIHPVVLPMAAGLVFGASGLALPAAIDDALAMLGSAVVPLCLVLIGLSLAYYGLGRRRRGAVGVVLVKLVVAPALVLAVAHGLFGLGGLPLSVIVMMAAAPVGSNALIFAQRYRVLETETTAAIVISTLAFALAAPLWLAVLARV